jgi:neutral ceramidase
LNRRQFSSVLAGAVAARAQSGVQLSAGVRRVDITPPLGIQMAGYNSTGRPAEGVLDPLYAQVLVLDDGRRKIALVTLDLIFTLLDPEMEQVRRGAHATVDDVIFVASHTHSGPIFMDPSNKAQREWSLQTADYIAGTINRAAVSSVPVRVGTGWGQCQIGANRRYQPIEGPEVMFWRNATKSPTFPVDPTVGVIRIDKSDGSPLAVLVNYACHPVIFGPDNRDYSADYPGEMRKTVEAAFPGSTCFFLQGGCGDINPYYDKTPLLEEAVRHMRETGRQLGDEVNRVLRTIATHDAATPEIGLHVRKIQFDWRWDRAQSEKLFAAQPAGRPLARYPLWGDPPKLPVTTLVINRELAFVGMPAEPFVEFQMYLRAQSPLPATFFLGYCNGNINYIPTIHAATRGGYGADNTITRVEVGAGEEMIHRGLVDIYRLIGKMK